MKSRAIGILVMVVIAAAAILCMVGFKGQSKETLPDGGTRYDLGDGDFVIEPGN